MPYRIGLLVYPLVPLVLILARRSPVSKFEKTGAISPQTARKPTTIDAGGDLHRPLRTGVLVSTGDGRYYVDVEVLKRQRRRAMILLIIVMIALGAALAWLWPPW